MKKRPRQDPLAVRLGDPNGRARRRGPPRPRRRRPRCRARAQSAALRGADRGRGAHGPRLRPDRGTAVPRRRAGDLRHPQSRRAAGPAHAARRGDPDRGGRRPKVRSAPRGVGEIGLVPTAGAVAGALEAYRRQAPHDTADEGFPRRPGHQCGPHSPTRIATNGTEPAPPRRTRSPRPAHRHRRRAASPQQAPAGARVLACHGRRDCGRKRLRPYPSL